LQAFQACPDIGKNPHSRHPNGVKIIQPGVATKTLPQVNAGKLINPERVASIPHIPFIKGNFVAFQKLPVIQPFQG